jgi:anti-sigma factor RsiW
MSRHGCDAIQQQLGPFVDGELTGAERLRVVHHLDQCENCASELGGLRALGETIRTLSGASEPHAPDLAGLAAGVISRSRAEADLSWGAGVGGAPENRAGGGVGGGGGRPAGG